MSGSDPSPPIPGAAGALRMQAVDASFETDFADLAARFTAKSGGGLSPELSADLALEIVLNEIVEQSCLATGATGAAIVLQRDGEMVCRASSGATAPELGLRLDTASGLSGECVKTRQTQRCDDVLEDSRADVGASQRLGVRSVMVMPLLRGAELVGVFELFSARPAAFGERDERTLEALARSVLTNLARAAAPLAAPREVPAVSEADKDFAVESEGVAGRGFDVFTWVLGAAVLACAVLLGVSLGRHVGVRKTAGAQPVPTRVPASAVLPVPAVPASGKDAKPPARESSSGMRTDVPPGSLLVFENGKEVFRMPPEPSPGGMQRAAAVEPARVDLPAAVAEGSLLRRVEPEYPEEARQQRVQGPVVLEVRIGADGTVQDVQVVSGPEALAGASSDAVKQWRFKPRAVNGRGVEMQTRVTLNFRLPE